MMLHFQGATHTVRPFRLNAMAPPRPNTHTLTALVPKVGKAASLAQVCQVILGQYGIEGQRWQRYTI